MTMTNVQPCIWQRRCEAALVLINAGLDIADRCKMRGKHGDFVILDYATVAKMIQAADKYRQSAEQEPQP